MILSIPHTRRGQSGKTRTSTRTVDRFVKTCDVASADLSSTRVGPRLKDGEQLKGRESSLSYSKIFFVKFTFLPFRLVCSVDKRRV